MVILLVEDNLANAELFVRILETAGYEVVHKTRAFEGLEAARNQLFDAIFLDFDLPDLDGSQICLVLRHRKATMPIIALTAHADRVTRRKAKMFGFNAFISKPCTDDDMLDTLRDLLSGQVPTHGVSD